jgi:hypothetical protein
MTTRRGSHVRPRPPSSGRSQAVKVAAPDRRRVRSYRGIDARRKRAPLATRTVLAASVVVLAGAAFLVASGGIGPMLSTLGAGFANAFGHLTATPLPSATAFIETDSPRITPPLQPYTNVETVELQVSIPVEVVGDPGAKVRIYLALEGLAPAPLVEKTVGTTSTMIIAVQLTKGRNDLSASLFRGAEESEQSPSVTYVLDQDPPKITVTSPKSGAAIDTPDVTIKGTTQAGTSLVALNDGNGTSISSVAAKDGTFEFGLSLEPGTNNVTITGTDPAGNVGTTKLKLTAGSAKMSVQLSASSYRISVSKHPSQLQLVVLVTDPSGSALPGARAFFTLQIPGLAPISNELTTGADGRAVFTTPLVGQLTVGGGLGTVLVTADPYGTSTDRVTLTFVK